MEFECVVKCDFELPLEDFRRAVGRHLQVILARHHRWQHLIVAVFLAGDLEVSF